MLTSDMVREATKYCIEIFSEKSILIDNYSKHHTKCKISVVLLKAINLEITSLLKKLLECTSNNRIGVN